MISKRQGQIFLSRVEAIMREMNISISHEDSHGAFLLEEFTEENLAWLRGADYGKYEQTLYSDR